MKKRHVSFRHGKSSAQFLKVRENPQTLFWNDSATAHEWSFGWSFKKNLASNIFSEGDVMKEKDEMFFSFLQPIRANFERKANDTNFVQYDWEVLWKWRFLWSISTHLTTDFLRERDPK